MDYPTVVIVLLGILVAIGGVVYRRFRAKGIPTISDEEFLSAFVARHKVSASREAILKERRSIARMLGVPFEKLAPEQTAEFLSARFDFIGDFSIGWNNLYDEAVEAREAAGLDRRDVCPTTVGEFLEDILLPRKDRSGRSQVSKH